MYRLRLLVFLIAAWPVRATSIQIAYVDPFGARASSCQDSSCDVVGDRLLFDFGRFWMVADSDLMTGMINIQTNFGPGNDLSPFTYNGVRLNVGDILFSDSRGVRYGIAVTAHGGSLREGYLYKVQDSAGVMTAFDVLQQGTGYVYRNNVSVWLRDDGQGSLSQQGRGSVTTSIEGDGITSGRFSITINFVLSPDFAADIQSGALNVQFSSTTGGNDVMGGNSQAQPEVPEAGTLAMIAAGLACLTLYKVHDAAPTIRRVLRS